MFDFEMLFLPIHYLTSTSIQRNVINENNSYVHIFNLYTEIYSLTLIGNFAQEGLNDNHVGFLPYKLMKDLIFFLFLERSFRMSWLNE